MNKAVRFMGFALSMSVASAAMASQGTLYFSQDGNGNGLYSIHTTTAFATLLGSSGVGGSTVGLAPSAGSSTLWGSQPFGMNLVNTDGSGFVAVGSASSEALGYDATTGTLYGALNATVFTIDTTSGDQDLTIANPTGLDFEGFAFGNRVLYALPGFFDNDTNLWQYNPITDAWSSIGDTGIDWIECSLAYDPYTDTLFAGNSGDTTLYGIDPHTGRTWAIGDTGINLGGGMAFVPEPLTLALFAPLAFFRLRRGR